MRIILLSRLQPLLTAALLALAFSGAPVQADDYPPQPIPPKQRCPVCGMYTAQFAEWATQVIFKDHSMVAPESPAELLRFLQDVGKYAPPHSAADIARIYVTDYDRHTWIAAEQAFFVEGSKQRGPMTADLPAFATREAAENFIRQAGGHITTFDALVPSGVAVHSGHGGHGMHHDTKH